MWGIKYKNEDGENPAPSLPRATKVSPPNYRAPRPREARGAQGGAGSPPGAVPRGVRSLSLLRGVCRENKNPTLDVGNKNPT